MQTHWHNGKDTDVIGIVVVCIFICHFIFSMDLFQDVSTVCPDMCTMLMQDTIALHKNNKARHIFHANNLAILTAVFSELDVLDKHIQFAILS